MTVEIHVGDIGTLFKVTIKDQDGVVVNIAAATTKTLVFRKPDGTTVTKAGAFFTDGTDGILTYTSIAAETALAGAWAVQAHIIFSATSEWYSSWEEFVVYGNL